MADVSNFIVRVSGRKPDSYYIDYSGSYKVIDISRISGIEPSEVKEIYLGNGAAFDETLDVYYFGSRESAQKAVSDIASKIKTEQRGKLIFLTMSEIEYIRKALINEGSNTIHIKDKIKDSIFNKLNF